jgi:hypothetical protein
MRGTLRALLGLALLLAFLAFVWPSFYRYDHITLDGDTYPVRIHRITGHADVLSMDGWEPMAPSGDQGSGGPPGPT